MPTIDICPPQWRKHCRQQCRYVHAGRSLPSNSGQCRCTISTGDPNLSKMSPVWLRWWWQRGEHRVPTCQIDNNQPVDGIIHRFIGVWVTAWISSIQSGNTAPFPAVTSILRGGNCGSFSVSILIRWTIHGRLVEYGISVIKIYVILSVTLNARCRWKQSNKIWLAFHRIAIKRCLMTILLGCRMLSYLLII